MIKMFDLAAEYQLLKQELDPVIKQVLEKGNYIQGTEVKTFERQMADFLKVKHVISCANGTDALQIALLALNIKNGDEVIIPAFSYISVIEVICLLGAKPVLVDVKPDTFQIDENLIEKVITEKTKAIIPVHLFGQCGNLQQILTLAKKHQLFVIEDNAQAFGGIYQKQFLGTLGDIGCTSFFPTKNLACFGDGGALFTNNDNLAERIRMIANHGQKVKYEHETLGVNSRLDTLQAAILSVKLNHLNHHLFLRNKVAEQYLAELSGIEEIELPKTQQSCIHSWNQFTIKVAESKRDALKLYLNQHGIESTIYYSKSLHQQKPYLQPEKSFTHSQYLNTSVLSLPIHPLLKPEDISYLCAQIKAFFHAKQ